MNIVIILDGENEIDMANNSIKQGDFSGMEFGAEQSVEILEDLKDYLGSFIFVEDGCHTGSFMLTRLLLHALRSIGDGFTEVFLVSTAYPLEHYEA